MYKVTTKAAKHLWGMHEMDTNQGQDSVSFAFSQPVLAMFTEALSAQKPTIRFKNCLYPIDLKEGFMAVITPVKQSVP